MMERGSQTDVLTWTARVLSADDLRRHLNGHREVLLDGKTIVTPLALDDLKAKGIRLTRGTKALGSAATKAAGTWGYAQEKDDPLVAAALKTLQRDGLTLTALTPRGNHPATWARSLAEDLLSAPCLGAVALCGDAALVCCVANKVAGIRAAAVANAVQTARALTSIGANLLAVEMPGRTLHEVRQILKAAGSSQPSCPDQVAHLLKEVEGHAHR